MTSFRFIHTADIHLDSPLRGLAGYQGGAAARIRMATRDAFDALVGQAIDEEVSFFIIAGDLYDGDWRDYQTGLFFVGQMGRLAKAGIPVFVLYGNHDAESQITRSLVLPDNVKAFSSRKPETFELSHLNVALHGQSFRQRDIADNLTSESSDIASRISIAEGERQTAQAAIVRSLQSLKPEVLEETALTSMSVPPQKTVQTHRDDRRKLEQHVAECQARIRAAEQQLVRHKKAQDRVARDEHAVPSEEIERVRKHRDAGWSLIRCRFVEGASICEEDVQGFTKTEDDLPAAYEAAVQRD